MKLETLQALWQEKNPGGNIWYTDGKGKLSNSPIGGGKKFAVTYKPESKVYDYSASSVYRLAERFDLIPESNLDYFVEAKKAIASMDAGITYTSICALHDTLRHLLTVNTEKAVYLESREIERDEYDRVQYEFTSYTVYNSYDEYCKARGW